MITLFQQNPLVLVFVVAALGHGLSNVRLRGAELGSMAILLVGLCFGALSPDLNVPDIIFTFGLALYIYTLGLEYGASFFASFGVKRSLEALFIGLLQMVTALIVFLIYLWLRFDATTLSGMFAGIVVNAASLASLLDIAELRSLSADEIIVGFSLSFPVSVLARVWALMLVSRFLKIDYEAEAFELRGDYPIDQGLESASILVNTEDYAEQPLRYLLQDKNWNVVFGRLYRGDKVMLATGETLLQAGDVLTLAGANEDLREVVSVLGERIHLEQVNDMTQFQRRRIFVTNPDVVAVPLATLDIRNAYGANVTRVQRGDDDFLATPDFVLELGDRVRVLARPRDMDALVDLFGDSYEAQNKLNLLTLGLGVSLGLMVGSISIGLTSALSFKLGTAGGCLVVSLILGSVRRVGGLVWTQPLGANHTVRQIAVALFLATVGLRSGFSFFSTLATFEGLLIIGVAAVVAFVSSVLALIIGYKLFKIPFSLLSGMVVSHPSALSYAEALAGNQLPVVGFTYSVPVGLITKVIIAQLLLLSLL